MSVCAFCEEDLPTDGDYIVCQGCNKSIHFQCSGLSENSWGAKAAAKKKEWRCARCRELERAGRVERIRSVSDDDLQRKGGKQRQEKSTLGEAIDTNKLMKDLKAMMQEQFDKQTKRLNDKLAEYEKSVCFNSQQVDEFLSIVKSINEDFKQIKATNTKLDIENRELKKELTSLRQEVEEMQQQGRKKNLQIHGLTERKEEDLRGIINRLSEVLAIPKSEMEIEEAYRLPSANKDQPRPVVVEFKCKSWRNNFLEKAKKKRLNTTDVFQNAQPGPIFVNEQLTPFFKKVFFEAKKIQREKNYKFLWTKDGRILMKKDEHQQTRRISNLSDLDRL